MTASRARMTVFSLLLAFVSLSAQAQNPNAGPPAGAGATIQSLANDVTAIKARLNKLESGAFTEADIVGTWVLFALGIEMGASPDGTPRPAMVSTETAAATLTFKSNGMVSITGKDTRFDLRQGAPWSLIESSPPAESGELPWTIMNGRLSIQDFGDLLLGAGGRILIWGQGSGFEPGHSWSQLGIAIRLP